MATGGKTDIQFFSDEVIHLSCSMCKINGKNTEGVKFCIECDDYFCGKCIIIHNLVPSCARHKVLDKTLVKPGTRKGLQRAPAERCDRHSYKHIDMYCQNHDKIGCSTCMVVDHKSCPNTFYIPDYLKRNMHKVAPKEIQTELTTRAEILTKHAGKYKQVKQNLLTRKAELLADIRKFRQEINHHLDRLERSSLAEIEVKLKILERNMKKGLKHLQDNKEKVTSALNKLTSSDINQTEKFVNMKIGEIVAKEGKDAAKVAKANIEDNKMEIRVESIQFNPDRTFITHLEKSNNLGMLDNLFQIDGEKTYNVKIKSDKEKEACFISSACYMEDGTIILVDNSNKNLKRIVCNNYTNNYSVEDYCELPGRPWQACSIDNSLVAVTVQEPYQASILGFLSTLPNGLIKTREVHMSRNLVHFISLDKPMKITHNIKTDFTCYGLAYANNNLYISDNDKSVYIYTLSGRRLNQISMDPSGLNLFSNIFSLAVSKDASRIYVADYAKGLIVLDNKGNVVSTYHGEKLQEAYCCYLTEAGSVLVSGYDSKNVLQFSPNGELIGEVSTAKERIYPVRTVCCNKDMSKMCIGRYNENKIEVYDILPLK